MEVLPSDEESQGYERATEGRAERTNTNGIDYDDHSTGSILKGSMAGESIGLKSVNSQRTRRTAKSKTKRSEAPTIKEEVDSREMDKREIMKLKRYKDQIKRPNLPMDNSLGFTEKELNVSSDVSARQAK